VIDLAGSMRSVEGDTTIASYRIGGEQLFFPNAVR
jgi:hypothetical protein